MRIRLNAFWSIACALALTTACGDSGPPDVPDSGPGVMDGGGGTDGAAEPACGDGLRQGGETCDDGNTVDGDGCSAGCNSNETCGNNFLDLERGELCDDGNDVDGDGCRGDCGSDYRCGNSVVDTSADGAPADETCDDGNTVNGDGCSAGCDSDETCGNGLVDLGAGEVCDDGNTEDGDDCSADCAVSLLCGNGAVDAPEECDDGNMDPADGCDPTCLVERCGNGRRDAGEACDDGNADDTDGCRASCEFTCSADADCVDTNACNGIETCTAPGTIASACAAGAPIPEGGSCGGGRICTAGACSTVGCGDGAVVAPEQCDDGNTVDGDGCDDDCSWTCASATDCSDANTCNGAESCTSPGTLASRCVAGAPPAAGTVCDRDASPATRDVCRTSTCLASVCGDGFIDAGASPVEQCDDGNTSNGDGCSSTCQVEVATPPTGFRITDLDLISPRVVIVPILGCNDVTQTAFAGFSVNGALQDALAPTTVTDGTYSLHLVNLFRPLSPASSTSPLDVHLNSDCMQGPTPDACQPDATLPDLVSTIANNMSAGTCFAPTAADVNTRAGSPATYMPTASTVSGPCFITDEELLTVELSGIRIPLQRARVAATYSGTPANRLVTGVVTGFLSEVAAADILLPADLPLIGGDPLYSHLQAGNRTIMNSAGMNVPDGCNVGGGANEDDADMNGTTRGFWFFLNFTAELITWSEP